MSNVSTFSAMTTARLGIYSSQKAMEVVGNNITNINTEGYTRQILDQKSVYMGTADRYISKSDVKVGAGARCVGVSQLRDSYLDIRYRNEMSSVGAMDAKLAGLEQLTTIIDEVGDGTDGSGVIEAQFSDLIEQMQNMVTSGAGKNEYDTLVRSSATSLATLFNTYAEKLSTLKKNTETTLNQDLTTVNDILKSIQTLNDEIHRSQIHGSDALELKDSRNTLIDQLSQYVRINVSYVAEPVGTGEQVDKLVISLAGDTGAAGKTLVDGGYITQLSITKLEVTPHTDPPSYYEDPNFSITLDKLKNKKGDIQGDVQILGDTELYGSIQSVRELLTRKGEYATDDDILKDTNAATKRGIPYYINTLDALANKFATVLNEANSLYDTVYEKDASGNFLDADGNVTTDPTTYAVKDAYAEKNSAGDFLDKDGNVTTDKSKYVISSQLANYKPGVLFSNSGNGDDTVNITAGNISVSKSWASGAVMLLQSKQIHSVETSTDNSNLTHILHLLTADQEYKPGDITAGEQSASKDDTFFTGGFQEMLGSISSTLANDYKTTTTMLDNYTAASEELYVDRESVSGVDLNDEAVNMMQYQKSYSAACRMLTTLDEMLDKLINGTAL